VGITSHFEPPRYYDDSDVDISMGVEIPVARSSWRLDFLWRRLVYVGSLYETCFLSLFWRLEFRGGP